MLPKFKMQVDDLEKAIEGFSKNKAEIERIASELQTVHNEMAGCWDGAACEEYLRRLKGKIDNLNKIAERIQYLINHCQKSIEIIKESDRKERERIRRIQETVEKIDKVVTVTNTIICITNPVAGAVTVVSGLIKDAIFHKK